MEHTESVSTLLRSPEDLHRMKAITLLARRPTQAHLALVRNLAENDESVDVRYFARKALNVIKAGLKPQVTTTPPEPIDLRKVKRYLEGTDAEKLALIQHLINRHLIQTVPLLHHALKRESHPEIAAALLKAIGVLGKEDAVRLLVPFLEHPNPRLRANAIEALDLTGTTSGYPFVIKRLRDPDNRVKANAIATVRKIPRVNTLSVLRAMLKSPQVSMQASAAFAMQWFPDEEHAVLLVNRLKSLDATVRANVMFTLKLFAQKGIKKAQTALTTLNTAGQEEIPARESLKTLETQVSGTAQNLQNLEESRKKDDPEERSKAILAAVDQGGLGIAPALIKALKTEKHPKVAATLIIALGRIRSNAAVPLLVRCLQHMNDRCRANAVEALRLIGDRKAYRHIPPLLQDPNNRTRANAILALHDEPGVDLSHAIADMVRSSDLRMQQSVLYAIRELENPQFYPFLEELSHSNSRDVAVKAREEISDLTQAGKWVSGKSAAGADLTCPNCRTALVQGVDHWVCVKCFQTIPLNRPSRRHDSLFPHLGKLPSPIAHALAEFSAEPDPTLKLWRAFDAVELLLRFLAILGVAEGKKFGRFSATLEKEIRERFSDPTLSRLKSLLPHLFSQVDASVAFMPECMGFLQKTLLPFLDSPTGKRSAETSFITLRTQLLHGRTLTPVAALNLLEIWMPRITALFHEVSWLAELTLLVQTKPGFFATFRGPDAHPQEFIPRSLDLTTQFAGLFTRGDEVMVLRGDTMLPVWPLLTFSVPHNPEFPGGTSGERFLQVYSRRDIRLEYSPVGAETLGISFADIETQEAFLEILGIQAAGRSIAEEFAEEAGQIIGREDELTQALKIIHECREGVLWLTGNAGIGKSMLMARLVSQLLAEKTDSLLVVPYRFRSGDFRHSRESFLHAAIRQIQAFLPPESMPLPLPENLRHSPDLHIAMRSLLERLDGRRVIFALDGLDELARVDFRFAGEVPFGMTYPGVTWLCAGRPEHGLAQVFSNQACRHLFAGGLPPLSPADIRAMILEKSGRLRHLLLQKETREGDKTLSPFIDSVTRASGGFPLYIQYVISDIQENRMSPLSAGERLPPSLETYHDDLLQRILRGPHSRTLPEITCMLAVAREPLTLEQLAEFLMFRKLFTSQVRATQTARECLDSLQSIVQQGPTGQGKEGFMLFHQSFREHMETSPMTKKSMLQARESFSDLVFLPNLRETALGSYLLRWGLTHLLEANRWEDAEHVLLDFSYLETKALAGYIFELAAEFTRTLEIMPASSRRRSLLRLLEKAIRSEIHFLDRHPEALFQCLWNRGWWYDAPVAAEHYQPPESPNGPGVRPWDRKGERFYKLLEKFRAHKEATDADFCWVRALRPPPLHLGSGQWAMFQGHEKLVSAVAFSPDGKRVASGSFDHTIRIWDTATGMLVQTLTGHGNFVKSVAYTPDGRRLASGASDGTVRLWDPESGVEQSCLKSHTASVEAVLFAHGYLISASLDKTIKVWSYEHAELITTLSGHTGPVQCLAAHPTERTLVSGGHDFTIRVWSLTTFAQTTLFKRHEDVVNDLAFAPSGERFASCSNDRTIRVWDLKMGAERLCLRGHTGPIESIDISPDGRILISGSLDKSIRLWNLDSGKETQSLRGHEWFVRCVAFSPDGRKIASGSSDKSLRLWDSEGMAESHALIGSEWFIRSLAFSPDGSRIAQAVSDKTVRVWETETCREIACLRGHEDAVRSVEYLDVGTLLLTGAIDRTARLWDLSTGLQLQCYKGAGDAVLAATADPTGAIIAAGSADRRVYIWDRRTGELLQTLSGHTAPIRCIAVSPDGRLMATGSEDATIRLWDLETKAELLILSGHQDTVGRVQFSPSGATLVSGSADKTMKLWSTDSGECFETIEGRGALDAIAGGREAYPWLGMARHGETHFIDADSRHPIGFFPAQPNEKVMTTHPSGRIWAMADGNHLYIVTLEGDSKE